MQRKVLALALVVLFSAILGFGSYAPSVHAQSAHVSHVSVSAFLGYAAPNNSAVPAGLLGSNCSGSVFVYELTDKSLHCWTVQDYHGTYITNVIAFGATVNSWVRVYDPAGSFFNLKGGVAYGWNPAVLITQICLSCGYHS